MFRIADVSMASLAVLMAALVVRGTFQLERSAKPARARRSALAVLLGLTLWLSFTAALSKTEVLSWSARPPRWPLLPLSAFVAIAALMLGRTTWTALSRVAPSWPLYAQTFRVGVELALLALYSEQRAPRQITFEGRNFDILVGLSAPLMGWLVGRGRVGPGAAIVWNAAGLAILANTVGTVATSTPGPLHLDWPGAPLTSLTSWPIVWLPAFLMPLAVFFHVLSLRLSGAARSGPSRPEGS